MMRIRYSLLICTVIFLAVTGGQAFTQTAPQKQAAQTAAQKPTSGEQQAAQASDRELNIRAYIELLRSDVKSQASAIVGEVMQLDDKEAKIFWPIYREYELELSKQGDRKVELIRKFTQQYGSMTNDFADQMAQAVFNLELERHNLKKKYYERIKQALSAITAARFLQINNQILMLIDLQIASALPVVR